jgi:hypothetical protein
VVYESSIEEKYACKTQTLYERYMLPSIDYFSIYTEASLYSQSALARRTTETKKKA